MDDFELDECALAELLDELLLDELDECVRFCMMSLSDFHVMGFSLIDMHVRFRMM